jgi:hypothetical protein
MGRFYLDICPRSWKVAVVRLAVWYRLAALWRATKDPEEHRGRAGSKARQLIR